MYVLSQYLSHVYSASAHQRILRICHAHSVAAFACWHSMAAAPPVVRLATPVLPPRLEDGGYAVDTVPLRVEVFWPDKLARQLFLIVYKGYQLADATWEKRTACNAGTLADDVVPLEARLRQEGQAELAECRQETMLRLQRELRRKLGRREGHSVSDLATQCWARIPRLMARSLFTERLDYLARTNRGGAAACRTWAFGAAAPFYAATFPGTRLRQLGHCTGQGADRARTVLLATARVGTGGPREIAKEVVFVLGVGKVFCRAKPRHLFSVHADHLVPLVPVSVRYSTSSSGNNFRIRGMAASFTDREWAVVQRGLPPW